jgi:hypothetical protein
VSGECSREIMCGGVEAAEADAVEGMCCRLRL